CRETSDPASPHTPPSVPRASQTPTAPHPSSSHVAPAQQATVPHPSNSRLQPASRHLPFVIGVMRPPPKNQNHAAPHEHLERNRNSGPTRHTSDEKRRRQKEHCDSHSAPLSCDN